MSLTIMEVIDNLKKRSGGGNEFVINYAYDESADSHVLDKTFDEIVAAVKSGLKPVIIWTTLNDSIPEYLYQTRYEFSSIVIGDPGEYSVNNVTFVNPGIYIYKDSTTGELAASGSAYAVVVLPDDTVYFVGADYADVYFD